MGGRAVEGTGLEILIRVVHRVPALPKTSRTVWVFRSHRRSLSVCFPVHINVFGSKSGSIEHTSFFGLGWHVAPHSDKATVREIAVRA